jgi:hypothetical protein
MIPKNKSHLNKNKEFLKKIKEIKQKDVEVLLKKSYRGIWETAIKKYSDSAHFVYELLQNADDTKATWVEFTLEKDGFWFKHNGKVRFTISDPDNEDDDSESGKLGHINAITSIGNSTKIDEQKIGKFGIGFKAVFAYSNTPHIFDDAFNFKIENYIVPIEIPANSLRRKKGETLFYFPFNHVAKSKEDAHAEIEEKLESLFQPILFLTNLKKINWVSSAKNGKYIKKKVRSETFKKVEASLVEVSRVEEGIILKEYIWLFSSGLDHKNIKSSHQIAVGFFLENEKALETGYQYDAFCFFPTKEETKLGFIIQAPFLLTDNREGIKAGDQWNASIMQLVANLAAESFLILKQIGIADKTFLINDKILDLIPYKESDFSNITNNSKISFKPFYNSILQKFKTEKLLPGRDAKYFSSLKSYWASDQELSELFSDDQISSLMGNPNSGWVFVSKGQKHLNQANKPLEVYISSIVCDILDSKKLLRRITAKFIEEQSDEWLLKFYYYLAGRKSLWDDKDKLVLNRPIILNQARKAVIPFDDEQIAPNIFLPTNRVTSYDTVYRPFVEDQRALEFIKSLGLGTPDLRAEIFKTIIPQYNEDFDYDDDTIFLHFESFLNYYEVCPESSKLDFISRLQDISFLASRNPSNSEMIFFCKPEQIYFSNEKLISYFANSSDVYLLDEDFYIDFINGDKKDKFYDFLIQLGVLSIPKVKEIGLKVTNQNKRNFSLDGYVVAHEFIHKQSITDKIMEGLEDVIRVITPKLSVIIWDYLLIYISNKKIASTTSFFSGNFRFVPIKNQYSTIIKFDSTLASILKKDKWLFDKKGNKVSADQLKWESISPDYNIEDAEVLLEFLGIQNPDADLDLTEEQRHALSLGRKLIEEGITQEELSEFINMLAARKITDAAQQKVNKNDEFSNVENQELKEEKATLRQDIERLKKQLENKFSISDKSEIEATLLGKMNEMAVIGSCIGSGLSKQQQKELNEEARGIVKAELEKRLNIEKLRQENSGNSFDFKLIGFEGFSNSPLMQINEINYPIVIKSHKKQTEPFKINTGEWELVTTNKNSLFFVWDGIKINHIDIMGLMRNQSHIDISFSTENLDIKDRVTKFSQTMRYFKDIQFKFSSFVHSPIGEEMSLNNYFFNGNYEDDVNDSNSDIML